jgi:DNA-binding NarL/FixJ family response regulator
MKKIKVMIVDDHVIVQEGLKQLLELDDDIEVIEIANSGFECMQLLEKKLNPDIILMDIKMKDISGIETTRLISKKHPHIKVIMLTIYSDERYVKDAIDAGAKGFVIKNVKRDELVSIIHHVMKDGSFLDPTVTACIVDQVKRGTKTNQETEKSHFTYRELEVVRALVAGCKDVEIAKLLNLSKHTIRSHIKNIFRKLGVSSRSQAITKVINLKIVSLE